MKSATIVGGVVAGLLLLALALGFAARRRPVEKAAAPAVPALARVTPTTEATPAEEEQPGFLYGRVTTLGGGSYEGRLRWGGDQEAFWGDTFNGRKDGNPWAALVPPERLPRERRPIEVFGFEIGQREEEVDLDRPFLARFGDISRIEASGRDVRVTLKSGTVFVLDRLEASDFDDGVRVWDGRKGPVDLDSAVIRSIELLPTPRLVAAPSRLHGTVRTRQGEFRGFVQWDREKGVGSDELGGRSPTGELRLRFETIRSLARRASGGALVTLVDGREVVLSGSRDGGLAERGLSVDDGRHGRVLVSWGAFERVDFEPAGSGPAYGDFPPGRPLSGSVTARDGRRLAGRLVYDLDESETTETLDAPSQGVDYTIPFGLIASIVPGGEEPRGAGLARVTLRDGEELRLESTGDLGARNAGLLVFVAGLQRPEYVPFSDLVRVDFDRPPAAFPPLAASPSSALAPPGRLPSSGRAELPSLPK